MEAQKEQQTTEPSTLFDLEKEMDNMRAAAHAFDRLSCETKETIFKLLPDGKSVDYYHGCYVTAFQTIGILLNEQIEDSRGLLLLTPIRAMAQCSAAKVIELVDKQTSIQKENNSEVKYSVFFPYPNYSFVILGRKDRVDVAECIMNMFEKQSISERDNTIKKLKSMLKFEVEASTRGFDEDHIKSRVILSLTLAHGTDAKIYMEDNCIILKTWLNAYIICKFSLLE